MAILAISAIREIRRKEKGDPEQPLEARAYIIRQFKRPSEIKLLRSVYGRQFIQISIYAPQQYRIDHIAAEERSSRGGLVDGRRIRLRTNWYFKTTRRNLISLQKIKISDKMYKTRFPWAMFL